MLVLGRLPGKDKIRRFGNTMTRGGFHSILLILPCPISTATNRQTLYQHGGKYSDWHPRGQSGIHMENVEYPFVDWIIDIHK